MKKRMIAVLMIAGGVTAGAGAEDLSATFTLEGLLQERKENAEQKGQSYDEEKFRKRYSAYDLNNDGSITGQEIALKNGYDLNNDGTVTEEEVKLVREQKKSNQKKTEPQEK